MIEIGEYIKTKQGKLDKVINNNYYMARYIECERGLTEKSNILKHSKNIIDLIEEGDYVNGKKVFATENRINDNGEKVILTENYDEWTDDGVIANKDIETILTKELFEANCYKVKEE